MQGGLHKTNDTLILNEFLEIFPSQCISDLQPYMLNSIYYFANKGLSSQSYDFSSSHV